MSYPIDKPIGHNVYNELYNSNNIGLLTIILLEAQR